MFYFFSLVLLGKVVTLFYTIVILYIVWLVVLYIVYSGSSIFIPIIKLETFKILAYGLISLIVLVIAYILLNFTY